MHSLVLRLIPGAANFKEKKKYLKKPSEQYQQEVNLTCKKGAVMGLGELLGYFKTIKEEVIEIGLYQFVLCQL